MCEQYNGAGAIFHRRPTVERGPIASRLRTPWRVNAGILRSLNGRFLDTADLVDDTTIMSRPTVGVKLLVVYLVVSRAKICLAMSAVR